MCAALALAVQSLLPACADTGAGRELFDQQCSQCHRGGPSTLRTPAAQVADLLQQGNIRPHRFSLSDSQLRDLDSYLKEAQADGR